MILDHLVLQPVIILADQHWKPKFCPKLVFYLVLGKIPVSDMGPPG